jgi:DNA polymerase-4
MRKIIHVDMDCFFAAVEMRDNPNLLNIPLAIGGSAN